MHNFSTGIDSLNAAVRRLHVAVRLYALKFYVWIHRSYLRVRGSIAGGENLWIGGYTGSIECIGMYEAHRDSDMFD